MDIRFAPVALPEIREDIRRHLTSLPSAIDSFLEDHIVESAHYRIFINEESAGFASIHKGSLITQFSLEPAFRRYGQIAFAQVRKLEQVQSAFVPTCDEFFLSHALDDYRQLAKQAYFFAANPSALNGEIPEGFTQRPAETGDAEIIRAESGDFFEDIAARIDRRELFSDAFRRYDHRFRDFSAKRFDRRRRQYRDVRLGTPSPTGCRNRNPPPPDASMSQRKFAPNRGLLALQSPLQKDLRAGRNVHSDAPFEDRVLAASLW